MDIKEKKAYSLLSVLLLLVSFFAAATPVVKAQETAVRVFVNAPYQSEMTLGDGVTDVRGTIISIAVVVEDVENLYGFDIRLKWPMDYLEYVDHTFTIPWNTSQTPIDPSPYAGILYAPVSPVPGHGLHLDVGEIWAVMASQAPAPSFYGDGTVFVLRLRLIKQQYAYEGDVELVLNITTHDLAGKVPPGPLIIPHEAYNGRIILKGRAFAYPRLPLLKILPETIKDVKLCENFDISVWLMGEGGVDLDPFWDISGFDFTVNFNSTLLEAVDVKIDPANWWLGFYPGGVWTTAKEIDNVTGRVRIAFMGIPDPSRTPPHDAPHGKGILATITFHVIYESEKYPPPSAPIWLENPLPLALIDLYSENGLINLGSPVSTDWHEIMPTYCKRFGLTFWEDVDGDGRLSPNDQIHLLDKETGKWLPYRVHAVPVTMRVDILPFEYTDEYHEGTTIFTNNYLTMEYYPDYEVYVVISTDWYPVNTSLTYLAQEVHSVEVLFPNGTRRLLTEGTEYRWFPNTNLIEIDVNLGTPETEYFVEDVNMTTGWEGYVPKARLNVDPPPTGWAHRIRVQFPEEIPPEYLPIWDGFQGAYIELFPAYAWDPDSYLFYADIDWNYFWAYQYTHDRPTIAICPDDKFPPGTEVWIDYMAQSTQVWVNYTALELEPRWIKSAIGAADFPFTAPLTSEWKEIMPNFDKEHVITGWTDTDGNHRLSIGDIIQLYDVETGETKPANITLLATGLTVIQKPVICTFDLEDPFYGQVAIVDVAGFPHPERPMCPWHNKAYSVPIPHKTEPATYTAPFKPPGRWIDLYLWGVEACNGTRWEYEDFAKGLGPNEPADAVQPQAKVVLHAFVTYNFQPIAGKSVTFELISPTGEFHIIRSAITGGWDTPLYGIAEVIVTIPWPYPDPEGRVFGTWNVIATVDIVKVVINDTLTFRLGYLIDTVFVIPGKQTYHKGEHMNFTLTYTSISHQIRTAYFTIVVYDELGVPIAWQILGPFNVTYGTHTIVFECMEVPHWAFRYRCTAYVNALTSLPTLGGAQYCPEIYAVFAIE